MADVRTLKLNLLADVDQFGRSLATADNDTKSFTKKVGKYSKAMAASFAVAGAAVGAFAIKLGVDSVKAAAEDEKSSRILEIQLQKTLGANKELTASVEDYISATQLRVGVQDDKLRPSFARLVRSTEDAGKAQQLLNLALDISVATGKPLETVSNALGKAYDGNSASLGRLGLGLDDSILKSKDFDVIGKELTRTFGGFADKEAKSLEGQLRIVNIRFDELKEGIGKKFLPILSDALVQVNKVAKAFSGEDPDGLTARARELKGEMGDNSAGSLGRSLASVAESFGKLFKAITDDGDEATDTMQQMADALNTIAGAITAVATAYQKAKSIGGGILDFIDVKGNPYEGIFDPSSSNYVFKKGRSAGGSVMGGSAYRVGEFGPELFVPSGSGSIRKDNGSGSGNTFIFNGVIDGESARRSIEKLLQSSARRTGAINLAGANL
jgi:hypothetical protein